MEYNNVNGTTDLRFKIGDARFDARTVAVIRKENKILLQKRNGSSKYALPGGGCAIQETTKEAMQRELLEEIGKEVEVNNLLFILEDFFKINDEKIHQFAFYYSVDFVEDLNLNEKIIGIEEGKNIEFEWVDLDTFFSENFKLKPTILKDAIKNIDGNLKHYIFKEYDF